MNNNKIKEYEKKVQNRRLSKFGEYTILSVGWIVSIAIAIAISFMAKDSDTGEISSGAMFFSMTYYLAGILGLLLSLKIKSDVTKNNAVSVFTRRISLILIPFVFTGNFFISIAGFSCAKENRTMEYTMAFYSFVNTVLIILISSLNLFKPYVANSFLTGIYILVGLSVFYLIMIFLTCKFTLANKNYNKLTIPAVLCVLSGVCGNLFAVLLGIIIFARLSGIRKNRQPEWIETFRRIFRNYMAIIGMFIVILLLSLSICSYFTFDYSIAIDNDYAAILLKPSLMYPFGTDLYGRCQFTRIVFGARISLVIGFVSAVIPVIFGGFLGAIAGHFGGSIDNIIMRILDIIYAVPGILLAIAIVAAFGVSTVNLIAALSIGAVPAYARTMRAQVMVVTSNEFIEAARACGRKDFSIIFKHIVPNALAPMIVRITLSIGSAVLSTSSMSFLGLGVEPHIPEWGNILKGGSTYLETHSYLAIYPGLAIILIVLAFNFFGDGLRDALDPKLK